MSSGADIDWTDKRPLAELTFGINFPEAERAGVDEYVRGILERLGVDIAEGIRSIGCTTLAAHHMGIDEAQRMRLGLGGCGIGLTCYVPPDRFCLVHETIGGLQENQTAQFSDQIPAISRELTAEERVKAGLVEHVRHLDNVSDRERADILSGRKLPAQYAPEDGLDGSKRPEAPVECPRCRRPAHPLEPCVQEVDDAWDATNDPPMLAPPFSCVEHTEDTDWACRYCLAEAVAYGALTPTLLLTWEDGVDMVNVTAAEVAEKLADLDKKGASVAAIYVKAARWSRRLARE